MTITGTVKWFNDNQGYGFITRDDGGKDCFVHHSQIKHESKVGFKSLQKGQKVQFEMVEGPRGAMAKNVVKL